MTKPRLKTLAAGGIASVTLLVAAAAYAADAGQLKDGAGKGVRTGQQDCVQTSGAGGQDCAAAAAPVAQPAAAPAAEPAAAAPAAAAATSAGPATTGAKRDNVQGGTGGAIRTGAGDCLKTGAGGGGAECTSGTTATAAGSAAPSAKPASSGAAAVAGPAGAAAGVGQATTGHLRDGHGSPVWTGNKECVNLGFSLGKDHPADCVVKAPVAKTPEAPPAPPAAAVPPPEKKAEAPAPAPVAVVPATTEGVNADAITDPTTKWSKQGAVAAPAAPAEAPAAVTAQPETPYPAPMPQFPELEPQAQVQEQGPVGDAPPYEVPGPNIGGGDIAVVPTDPQAAGDEATDPTTKWSQQGAGQAAEGSTQLPQDSVAATPVAPPEPVAEAPVDLKTPEPMPAPAPAAVPAPEKIAEAPTPPKPAEPEKVPAPEYEKFVLSADALFHFDRYTRKFMLPEGKQKLDELAATLNRYTGVQSFNVIGHTDRIGSHKYNDRLSLRRAATVKQYLAEKGVDANLMKISGKGKRQPVVNCPGKKVTKKLKACLQPNRRVEVEVRGERKK